MCLAFCRWEKIWSSLAADGSASAFRISSVLIYGSEQTRLARSHLLPEPAGPQRTRLMSRRRPSCRSKSCSTTLKEKQMEKNMVAWQTPDAWDDSSSHRAKATMSDSTGSGRAHTCGHKRQP